MILRAMMEVAQLLVGSPMPDRSKVMTQTKRDTLLLWVGCGVHNPTPQKDLTFDKLLMIAARW
jgi:hypothetical protein